MIAVMDAARPERAVTFTALDTCPTGVLFRGRLPEWTAGLETKARVRREWGTPARGRLYRVAGPG